jgi:type IV pilus assembly protein PilN
VIRVNLLPQKRETKRGGLSLGTGDGGQAWLLVALGVILFEIFVLVVFQRRKQDELDFIMKKNAQVQSNIDDIKRQMANHADIKNQLKELRDREDAIARLETARTGPTAVMLELSHVLTQGRGPTTDRDKLEQLKRDDPTQVPNPNWDPRRLWLLTYSEVDRTVKLSGLARDGEDVAELLKRLTLSDYFYELRVLPASKTTSDAPGHLELMKFELSAKVRY